MNGDDYKPLSEPGDSSSLIDTDVVIVGAGISGLSAAYFIHKKDAGINLAVLEAKGYTGKVFRISPLIKPLT